MNAPAPYQPMNAARPASQATSIEMQRAIAQVQAQVVVAQNCPRDMNRAWAEMREACGRTALAERAFYRVTNRGKGPSVHLLRELARIFGNIEHGMHELARDDHRGAEGESEIQAYAWDIQKNTRSTRTFIVPHAQMVTVGGNLVRRPITNLNDVNLNNQNQASRAVRECITTILPRDFVEEAQTLCNSTLTKGDGTPLQDRILIMVQRFGEIGVNLRQLEAVTGKKRGQWDAADVAELGISYTSITRDGFDKAELFPAVSDVTAEELLAAPKAKAKPRPKARQELETEVVDAAVKADQAEGNDITTPEESPAEPEPPQPEPPQPSPVDPTPDNPEVPMISGRQLGIMLNLFASAGPKLDDEEKRLAWIAAAIDRTVAKLSELTTDEAADLILMLRQDQEQASES